MRSLLSLCMLTCCSAALRLPRCSAALRLPTLGYTVDSFAPAQLALRANLRLLHLAPAPALDCLSPRSVRYRAGVLRCATVASFAPAHLALRAACGRLPSQRPLACVRSRSVDSQALPTCSPFGVAFGNLSPFGRLWLIPLYSGLLLHVCSLTVVSHKA